MSSRAIQRLFLTCNLAMASLCGLAAAPEAARPAGPPDYSEFRIINERNIFNSRRYARLTSSTRRDTRASRVESFALLGTMSYEKGPFAFFEGTRSDYQKVIKPAETIAGYTVTEIGSGLVKLDSGTNQLELRVGMQMRREDDGPWHMTERVEAPEPASERPVASTQTTTTNRPSAEPSATNPDEPPPIIIVNGESAPFFEGGPPPDGAEPPPNANELPQGAAPGTDDVLRRLMERRRQEENP